jgi:hypothetical protein
VRRTLATADAGAEGLRSWTYTTGYVNNTISITNGTQCLDRPDGTGLHLQTYTVRAVLLSPFLSLTASARVPVKCTSKNVNNNQQWDALPSQWFLGSGSK